MAGWGERNVGYLLNQAGRLLDRQLTERLKDLGMSTTTFLLLRSISAAKDRPVMVVDVADDLRMDPAAVASAVEHAVEQGWIVMEPIPRARRARILALTPKAKTARPAMSDAVHWSLEAGLNGFRHEEIEQLKGFLERFVHNLEVAADVYSERS